ncbi:MAG: hypothetical protein LBE76_07450 [Nitrososphaerota archaeon]|jgi:uncharacterized repeat protein (TIGR02543 family)|nr:hypothetical protein [Nitrososphaerota archaeon]
MFDFWGVICDNGSAIPLYDSVIPAGTIGEILLVAVWNATPISYDITYSLGGGINGPGNTSKYAVTDNFPITINNPTKPSATFAGWIAVYANATITGPTLNYSIPDGTIDDITLVAMWI